MSTPEDRLTILEMEYALVSARLNAIDAELALIGQRLKTLESKIDRLGNVPEQLTRVERMLTEVVRHLGLGDES